MATVGCLGDIIFEVSSKSALLLDNFQWSGSANYSTHARHLGNALTEFTGLNPDTITFDLTVSIYLGYDPALAINNLWQYERGGIAVPLTVGSKAYGKYRWTVVSHSLKATHYLKDGSVSSATVSVSLQEYLA